MAQFSMLWETQTGTGDGASSYTQEQARVFHQHFTAANAASAGVLSGIDNELKVSGTISPLSVDTGKAVVYGFRYWSTAVESLAVTTPLVGDTGGRVVLRADWTLNTVRSYVVLNSDGNPAIPALTQTPASKWEISLASFVIDTAGNIWTDASKSVAGVTDARAFAISPLAGMVKLREYDGDGLTVCQFTEIQQDLTGLVVVGYGRSTLAGTTDVIGVRFNGDSGVSYDYSMLLGNAGAAAHNRFDGNSYIYLGDMSGAGSAASVFDPFRVEIPFYRAAGHKAMVGQMGGKRDGSTGAAGLLNTSVAGWWRNTAAINRVDIATPLSSGKFAVGTKILLYGVR